MAQCVTASDAPVLSLSFNNSEEKAASYLSRERYSLRTATSSIVKIDFVEGSEAVVGLQFDLEIGDDFNRELVLDSCGGQLASGHQITCSITQKNNLRVIVASVTNLPISTGMLAEISLGGLNSQPQIIKESVQMGNSQAQAVTAEIL